MERMDDRFVSELYFHVPALGVIVVHTHSGCIRRETGMVIEVR